MKECHADCASIHTHPTDMQFTIHASQHARASYSSHSGTARQFIIRAGIQGEYTTHAGMPMQGKYTGHASSMC